MSVSFLLKSEPVEIIQKFEFLVKDQSTWKFLETFRVPNIAFDANGIRKKNSNSEETNPKKSLQHSVEDGLGRV